MRNWRNDMHVNKLPQIFRDCCAKEARAYRHDKPFLINGVVYATDGSIVVRMPAPKVKKLVGGMAWIRSSVTPADLMWNDAFADPIDIPRIPLPKFNADGEELATATAFGKVRLNNKYLRIIRRHGGKLRLRVDGDTYHPVAFIGDGWDGLLMTCNP